MYFLLVYTDLSSPMTDIMFGVACIKRSMLKVHMAVGG